MPQETNEEGADALMRRCIAFRAATQPTSSAAALPSTAAGTSSGNRQTANAKPPSAAVSVIDAVATTL